MPIDDVRTPESDGWWLRKLADKLAARRDRLHLLNERYEGRPPLPKGAEAAEEAYRAFQEKARTNYAELISESVRERMQIGGFRTAATEGRRGEADNEARRIAEHNGLEVEAADVHESMLAMGDGYVIVGMDNDEGTARITGEDPRQVVTIHDPVQQRRVRAALKMFHDPDLERDFAYLYLPGRVRKAQKASKRQGRRFNPQQWDWVDEGAALPHNRVPVVRFRNKRGVGEFEPHTDLLDRINHMLLTRMVIATFQAFRQMAVKGLPETDEHGNPIDWAEMFVRDPGAFWQVPQDVEFWESGQVDLTPILSSVKDDVRDLAAVSRTPMSQLAPDNANQSAEGAAFQREGLVFKTEDRIARASQAWKDVMSLAFAAEGDEQRADRSGIEVLWQAPERRSLAERADAGQKATDLPWRVKMEHIWDFTPKQVDDMEAARAQDQLVAAELMGDTSQPSQNGQVSVGQP